MVAILPLRLDSVPKSRDGWSAKQSTFLIPARSAAALFSTAFVRQLSDQLFGIDRAAAELSRRGVSTLCQSYPGGIYWLLLILRRRHDEDVIHIRRTRIGLIRNAGLLEL